MRVRRRRRDGPRRADAGLIRGAGITPRPAAASLARRPPHGARRFPSAPPRAGSHAGLPVLRRRRPSAGVAGVPVQLGGDGPRTPDVWNPGTLRRVCVAGVARLAVIAAWVGDRVGDGESRRTARAEGRPRTRARGGRPWVRRFHVCPGEAGGCVRQSTTACKSGKQRAAASRTLE